jgi:hypothetical protein
MTLPYTLPAASSAAAPNSSSSSMEAGSQRSSCRFVQYAVDAVGAESAGLYCLWDGQQLCEPGVVVPVS